MMASSTAPFSPFPKINAGRDSNVDLAILIFSHTPRSVTEWQSLLKPETGDTVFKSRVWKATGAIAVSFVHVQPLDCQKGDDSNGNSSVLEILAHTAHNFINLEDCRRFRQHDTIQSWEKANNADVVFQPSPLYFAHKANPRPSTPSKNEVTIGRLAVFDMDSTLIQQEVIDELARKVGLYSAVSAITEAAMRGEAPYTDFEASLRARVKLLKGVPTSVWEELKSDTITFTPGARELIRVLRSRGWKTAVLSGGFTPLAMWVKETLGMDYAFANHLVEDVDAGVLTGELVEGKPIVHGAKKRELLLQLAQENDIPIERTLAVGDGSNDLPMMNTAGLGIAFNAKPKVQHAAPIKLNGKSLVDVLYVLGFSKQEIATSL